MKNIVKNEWQKTTEMG